MRFSGRAVLRAGIWLLLAVSAACSKGPSWDERLAPARHDVSRARSHRAHLYAPQALQLAELSLWQAERELRRHARRLTSFTGSSASELRLNEAIDSAKVAAWVAERNLHLAEQEARALVWAARSGIDRARQTAGRMNLPHPIRTRLSRAELALLEASYLLRRGEYLAASERARWAHELAGGAHGESEKLVARLLDPEEAGTWKGWVAEVVAATRANGSYGLIVDKSAHQAVLYEAGKPHRRFDVDLGYNSLNQKLASGDGATPEGRYRVVGKKGRGQSRYYKALLLDYPNGDDLKRHRNARRDGRLSGSAHPGGAIEIHGDGGRGRDWTEGCVALSNRDLDYAFARLSLGSPVVIVGSLAEASPADRP
jgi:hypothetical protein